MVEILENILDVVLRSPELPLVSAVVLGLLVAVNPCQLAINVSALSYQYRGARRWVDGLSYALGRAVMYTLMGWVLMCLMGGGRNIEGVGAVLGKAEAVVPYILIMVGAFLLFRSARPHHRHDDCHNCRQLIRRNGPLGSLVLGMTLALAFCPESAVFYFGMMLPLAMKSDVGVLVPMAFSAGASVPVIVLSWVMLKAFSRAAAIDRVFGHMQRWLNMIVGLLMVTLATVLLFE